MHAIVKSCVLIFIFYIMLFVKRPFTEINMFLPRVVRLYFRCEVEFLPNKVTPVLKTEGCAFFELMEYYRALSYCVCHKKVHFYSTLKTEEIEFATKCGVKVPKQIGTVNREQMDEEDFQFPAGDFVLKPVDGCKSLNVFLKRAEHELLRKIPFTRESIVDRIENGAYDKDIFGKYVMEELLVSEDGKCCPPSSYKFFVLQDKIINIFWVGAFDPGTKKTPVICIDSSHQKIPNLWTKEAQWFDFDAEVPSTPLCWDEMIESVKKVGRAIELFVRVDMYATSRGAVFGEFGIEFDSDDWTPQCSRDLFELYDTLSPSEKENVIPNPFTPCMSANNHGTKLYRFPFSIQLLIKLPTLLLLAMISMITFAINITVSWNKMLTICVTYALTCYTLDYIVGKDVSKLPKRLR